MRANEFVKKFGWLLSKAFAENWSDLAIHYGFNIDDLKRLIESHELVEDYGGVGKTKDFILPYSVDQLSKKVYSPMLRIKQAILDVESCQ